MTTETPLEHRLREDLRARQADVPRTPSDLADQVRRRHRSQRRAHVLTGAAAVAVAVVVAGAGTLVSRLPAPGTDDAAAAPSSAPAPALLDLPTRGSLAGDEDWLDGVRRLDWEIPPELFGEIPEPSVPDRRVAFAGDVPGGRAALVVGEDDGRLGAAWFLGPQDAAPGEMELAVPPQEVLARAPQALVRMATPTAGESVVVVVTRPGWSVELTTPPVVDAEGRETSDEVELPVEDGIVASRVDAGFGGGAELRTREGDRVPALVYPTVVFDDEPDRSIVSGPDGIDEQVLADEVMERLLVRYDLDPASTSSRLLASGAANDDERALLVGLTFPSGATGVWLSTYREDVDEAYVGSMRRLPHAPAGTALEDRLVAAPVDGYHLAVRAPAGAVRAQVLDSEGDLLGALELTDGAYVGEVPGGAATSGPGGAATVRALDAAGGVVAEGRVSRVVTG